MIKITKPLLIEVMNYHFYTGKLLELENIEKKTEKPFNIIHVNNQLRKRYYPAACANAEEKRRKRRE